MTRDTYLFGWITFIPLSLSLSHPLSPFTHFTSLHFFFFFFRKVILLLLLLIVLLYPPTNLSTHLSIYY